MRLRPFIALLAPLAAVASLAWAQNALQPGDLQPLLAQVGRVQEALTTLGAPLSAADRKAIEGARELSDTTAAFDRIQKVLDRRCLYYVTINPESRVKAAAGPARPELTQGGWTTFLIKLRNEAGVTAPLRLESKNAGSLAGARADEVLDRWLEITAHTAAPLAARLSGLPLEYRVVSLYSRDRGKREARVGFNVGQGTQDLGFRSDVDTLFECRPAHALKLRLLDELGKPTTAGITVRDPQGRVYPSQAKRLAPDFAFHPQVYRADGETVSLPAGEFTFEVSRGPEYLTQRRTVRVTGGRSQTERFQLERWIDPAASGWWSGDHHIHAAGCAHYEKPTEGVLATDMFRHCMGEDLKIGANLTWGPCFDYQKQFFTGQVDKVSRYPYLLRYDVEVSGFGSHESGHLCLLRLKDQIYPGGNSKTHWPKLCLNTYRWAKRQGAVCGPAHSGWGLEVATADLPNYVIPPYSGIGANEYVVDVTHELPGPTGAPVPAVDFMSTVDTPYVWELNMWYQTLNCGYRTRASGETDFPCIYGERVGLGRSYAWLPGKLDYDSWCEAIRNGANYVGDGRSHLIDFALTAGSKTVKLGREGSELRLDGPGTVTATARVAAMLPLAREVGIRERPYNQKPYWHLERARVGEGRDVPVELVVNGYPVERRLLRADGHIEEMRFTTPIRHGSWVALRILPSSHTNPIFVTVGGKPIRASRRSAEWCLKGVDQCWSQKQRFIAPGEMNDAREAYEHARQAYRRILAESAAE